MSIAFQKQQTAIQFVTWQSTHWLLLYQSIALGTKEICTDLWICIIERPSYRLVYICAVVFTQQLPCAIVPQHGWAITTTLCKYLSKMRGEGACSMVGVWYLIYDMYISALGISVYLRECQFVIAPSPGSPSGQWHWQEKLGGGPVEYITLHWLIQQQSMSWLPTDKLCRCLLFLKSYGHRTWD